MGSPDPPKPRACCLLAADVLSGGDNILDPSKLGHHKPVAEGGGGTLGGDGVGIMFMEKLGIIDFGHLRDLCDLTKYVYDRLLDGCPGAASRRASGTPGTCTFTASTKIRTTHGWAKLKGSLADSDLLPVAQSIAYDDSVGYEIYTYWVFGTGYHNSSFSPEDLPSNYVGTWTAAEAVKRTWTSGKGFNDEVDAVLADFIKKAEGRPKSETDRVFTKYIEGLWVKKVLSAIGRTDDDYLRRRNFKGGYWNPQWDDINSRHSPSTVGVGSPGNLSSYSAKYDFTFDHDGNKFTRDEYPQKIQDICVDANNRYGPLYDVPDNRKGEPLDDSGGSEYAMDFRKSGLLVALENDSGYEAEEDWSTATESEEESDTYAYSDVESTESDEEGDTYAASEEESAESEEESDVYADSDEESTESEEGQEVAWDEESSEPESEEV